MQAILIDQVSFVLFTLFVFLSSFLYRPLCLCLKWWHFSSSFPGQSFPSDHITHGLSHSSVYWCSGFSGCHNQMQQTGCFPTEMCFPTDVGAGSVRSRVSFWWDHVPWHAVGCLLAVPSRSWESKVCAVSACKGTDPMVQDPSWWPQQGLIPSPRLYSKYHHTGSKAFNLHNWGGHSAAHSIWHHPSLHFGQNGHYDLNCISLSN